MKRFKSIGHAQRFLSAFSGISPHFRPRRHLLSAADYRQVMADRFAVWNEITGATTMTANACTCTRLRLARSSPPAHARGNAN